MTLIFWVSSYWCEPGIYFTSPSARFGIGVNGGAISLVCLSAPRRQDTWSAGISIAGAWARPPDMFPGVEYRDVFNFPGSYSRSRTLGIQLYWPFILLSLTALWQFRQLRPNPGLCPTCGYDLRATPERCPECGATPSTTK